MPLERKIFQIVLASLLSFCVLGVSAYLQAKYLLNQQLEERTKFAHTENQILRAQVHFKKQVQEWKNILLRGANPEDFNQYLNLFKEEEKKTVMSITALAYQMPEDSESAALAQRFIKAHQLLSSQYQEGLSLYQRSDQNAPFVTDRLVRGIDRAPMAIMDELAKVVRHEGSERLKAIKRQQTQLEVTAFLLFVLFIAGGIYAMFIALHREITIPLKSAITFANKIANGNLKNKLKTRASGDIAQLIKSLNTMQKSLHSSYEELKLSNIELELARDNALQATNAKTNFLANMSHEIRTPLNGVIGITDLLLKTKLTHEQRDYCDMLLASGSSLLVLVNDILDISKIEKGIIEIQETRFSPVEVIEKTMRIVSENAEDSALDYACIFKSSIPNTLIGDPWRIEQVLVNILNNAIKFTDKGGVSLNINAFQKEGQTILSLDISDTGIGIPVEKLEQVFENFSQVDSSASRIHGGAGLGLAISKHIIELMGGTIKASSAVGKGSRFEVELPFPSNLAEYKRVVELPCMNHRLIFLSDRPFQNQSLEQMLREPFPFLEIYDTKEGFVNFLDNFSNPRPPAIVFIDNRFVKSLPEDWATTLYNQISQEHTPLVWVDSTGDDARIPKTIFGIRCHHIVHRPLLPGNLVRTINDMLFAKPQLVALENSYTGEMKQKACVLIVEDNQVNQMIITRILENEGHDFDIAENGREAVSLALSHRYDCILMDCQMPVMDGYTATREIRRMEGQPNFIVALTAHAMAGDREKCIDAGMDDYLSKPIKPTEFAKHLKTLLTYRSKASRFNIRQA